MLPEEDEKLSFFKEFASNGVAMMISKTVAAPLERIKLMLQNQDLIMKLGRLDKPFIGVHDCAHRIINEEGPHRLWRGNIANCLRSFPEKFLKLALEDTIKTQFKRLGDDGYLTRLGKRYAICVLPPLISLCFLYPLHMAQTQLACDTKCGGGEYQFGGILDVLKKAFACDGVQGLYRGFFTTCVDVIIYNGLWFGMFEAAKELTSGRDELLLGFAVTILSGIISYPVDTISRRITMTSHETLEFSSQWDYALNIMRNHGIRSLFRGAQADILNVVVYSCVLTVLKSLKEVHVRTSTYMPKL